MRSSSNQPYSCPVRFQPGVFRNVRVEQVQWRVAEGSAFPHLHPHLFVADREGDDYACVLEEVVPILVVAVVRAIVLIDELLGVVLVPQDADPDHRSVCVHRRFQDVARQDAQTPGVDVQLLMQPELHTEVGYSGRSIVH